MAGKNIILVIILYFVLSVFVASKALAVTIPSFPSCLNIQGELIVSYTTGTHGIPGDSATYTGSDSVYKLTEDTLTQCFCSVNGDGIQTNWWKVSSLSDNEITDLKNQNWIFILNGSLWGLDDAPYMAKNSNFSCQTTSPTPTPTSSSSSSSSGSSSSSSSSSSSGSSGSVQAASTGSVGQVLGLATTGNILTIYTLLIVGITFILLGI